MEILVAFLISVAATVTVGVLDRIFGLGLLRRIKRLVIRLSAGRLGLVDVVEPSTAADALLRSQIKDSESVCILQVRGHDLLTRRADPILKTNLRERTERGLETRLLLLNPHCNAAHERAKQIGLGPIGFRRGIQATIEEVANLRRSGIALDLRLYSSKPIFSIALFDEVLLLAFYSVREDRQNGPTAVIRSGSVLYGAFQEYFASMWADHSQAADKLSYHYEVEIKAKIEDHPGLARKLEELGATARGSRKYHDHYFTPVDGIHAESSGLELRVRCDLLRERMFLTEKKPFNAEMAGSKIELETFVGSITEFPSLRQSVLDRGFEEYVDFFKWCRFYTLHHGGHHFHLALVTAAKTDGELEAALAGPPAFLEIEISQPEGASEERIRQAHIGCERLLETLGETVSGPVSETYSSRFLPAQGE